MCATTHPGRAPTAGRPCRSGSADAVRLGGAMSHPSPPADLLDDVVRALTPAYRLDQRVAATPERAVYHAWDRVLKRSVALHVYLAPDSPGRAWFLRETKTLARSEEHTSELQSLAYLVCRLLLEKKNNAIGQFRR